MRTIPHPVGMFLLPLVISVISGSYKKDSNIILGTHISEVVSGGILKKKKKPPQEENQTRAVRQVGFP